MNRNGFLKSLATLVAAPSLIANMEVKAIMPSNETKDDSEVQNLELDRFRVYTEEPCCIGETIRSDMGSLAKIVSICRIGKSYIEARPMRYKSYHFKDATVFYRLSQIVT